VTTLDLALEDARGPSASPKRSRKDSAPKAPKADVPMLYKHLDLVRNSLACSDWASAAYYACRVADIWAGLDEATHIALSDDFHMAPDPFGDWSTASWIVFCTFLSYWREGLVPTPQYTPFSRECPPRISLVHGRE
jgi:hypothetical protein